MRMMEGWEKGDGGLGEGRGLGEVGVMVDI